MVEPEIAFADLKDNADLAEDFLKYVFSDILDRCADDMEQLQRQVTDKSKIIKRLTMTAGVRLTIPPQLRMQPMMMTRAATTCSCQRRADTC